jgi:hypothetical protein
VNRTRLGLIVNPSAGGGEGLRIARQAIQALAPRELFVGAGEMGADALREIASSLHVIDWQPHSGKARTQFLAERFATENLDALVVIGGDGTLADVALAIRKGQATPLLGIGVGSANVGPLITCQGKDVQQLANAKFATHLVDGLIAGVNSVPLGLGFNDVVIGFTVLATVSGQVVDVDAAQKMQDRNVPREPESIGTENARVVKISPSGETIVARGNHVVTLIAGFPDERFFGKAITGGVLLSGLTGDPAGCLVCDHMLVRTQMDAEQYRRSEPVVSYYVGLNESEHIEASNLRDGAILCADGNPLSILHPSDRAQITAQRALVRSIKIEES